MNAIVLVLNGPNLDVLGARESDLYGTVTYEDLVARLAAYGRDRGLEVVCRQTAGEGELVAMIHEAGDAAAGLLINAAAYTHTSVAVRDALLTVSIPVVEVHITNPYAREEFRKVNLISDVARAGVHGFGVRGYEMALAGLVDLLDATG